MLVSKNEGLRQKSAKTENYGSLHLRVSEDKRRIRGQVLILVCLVNIKYSGKGVISNFAPPNFRKVTHQKSFLLRFLHFSQ